MGGGTVSRGGGGIECGGIESIWINIGYIPIAKVEASNLDHMSI